MTALIIDGYVEIFKRLKELVSDVIETEYVFWASNPDDALAFLNNKIPEVIILDTRLLRDHSFDLLKNIRKLSTENLVIVLSCNDDNQFEEQCFSLGADYFLDKYNEFDKIPEIITAVTATKNKISQ